jgi:hypothetical protein
VLFITANGWCGSGLRASTMRLPLFPMDEETSMRDLADRYGSLYDRTSYDL